MFYRGGAVLLSLAAAAAVGWVAFQLQQQQLLPGFVFPLLFPLLVGAAVGAACAGVLGKVRLGTTAVLLVAICGGLLAVTVEVLSGYQSYVATIERQLHSHPMAAIAQSTEGGFAPVSLARFVAVRIRDRGGWWFADAILTVMGGAITAWLIRATYTPALPTTPSDSIQTG